MLLEKAPPFYQLAKFGSTEFDQVTKLRGRILCKIP